MHDGIPSMLSTMGSYLFCRSVYDVETNSSNESFSFVITRLNAVRDYASVFARPLGTVKMLDGTQVGVSA